MKRISVLLVLLLVGILTITTLGCGYTGNLRIWDGWFTDDITEENVECKGRIEILEVTVDDLPFPFEGTWQLVNGNIHITGPTEAKDARIQVRSKYRKNDSATANMFYKYESDTKDRLHTLYSPDCKVNGRGGYILYMEWHYGGVVWATNDSISIVVADSDTLQAIYRWERGVDRTVEPLFDLDNWRYKYEINL